MDSTSQEAHVAPNQLQLIAEFLEDLSETSESQVEAELCRAVAENYRTAANRLAELRKVAMPQVETEPQFAPGQAA
jgi:hypothetical protein